MLGMCKSVDSGATFDMYYPANGSNNLLSPSPTGTGGQGSHNLAIAIDPYNANEVLVGGIISCRSIDGGLEWTRNYEMHSDQQYIAYHPLMPNTVFGCNDGGIYKSVDSGKSWINLTNGLGTSQIYHVAIANTADDRALCGMQDNGTYHLAHSSWINRWGGDGGQCLFDDTDTSVMYVSTQGGNVYKSTDRGYTINSIVNSSGTGVNSSGSFITNYTMDPTNHNILYIGKAQIYKSTDGGTTWSQTGTIANTQGRTWSITVAPSDPQVVYAANSSGFYKSINGGASWTTLPSLTDYGSTITVDANNANRLWYTASYFFGTGVVFKSNNGGLSFTNITGSIPAKISANCSVFEKGGKGGLYVGTDIGVFYRDSTMSDWIFYNDGLPNVPVRDLQISYASGKLWAGTFGRGLWSTPLYTSGTLPLKLLSFTARIDGLSSLLDWKTSNETDTKSFIIERSSEGNLYKPIGNQTAANSGGEYAYSFRDKEPIEGIELLST